ncbi:MAG: glycosyltransferase family 2 protein [Actinobacteria bacterium]|nr:glycosyltransferase family 2 protein [Actinomycetota bacterium]
MSHQSLQDEKINVICLTPVRNEEWIINTFLKCASLWADKIIISDQNSIDKTINIVMSYPKVKIIKNDYDEYNEWKIRKITYDEARKIKGKRLLIALDADEVFTPEIFESNIWNKILSASPGTIIKSKFVNLLPDLKHYWVGPIDLPWGFMDDGSDYIAEKIHTNRMIYPENARELFISEVKVMHFQFTDWERMESKHRWYQCWERINNPNKSPIEIYRSYHHMYSIKDEDIKEIPDSWINYYLNIGIDLKNINKTGDYYWDKQVLNYINQYGARFFSKIAIWDIAWDEKAKYYEFNNPQDFKDPRIKMEKYIHNWLKNTQNNFYSLPNRIISKILKIAFGW